MIDASHDFRKREATKGNFKMTFKKRTLHPVLLAVVVMAVCGSVSADDQIAEPEIKAQADTGREARTATSLLGSLKEPVDNNDLIRSMLEQETLGELLTWVRILAMSPEQHNRLLNDLQAFPCDDGTKDLLINRCIGYGTEHSPREQLERIVSSGRSSATQRPMLKWAALEPESALGWFRDQSSSGVLTRGRDGQLAQTILTDLLCGLAVSEPHLAFEVYQTSSREKMHEWIPMWLASAFAEQMLKSGDETHVLKMLQIHSAKDRIYVLRGIAAEFARSGKFDQGLHFVTKHDPSPEGRMDYFGHMFTYGLPYHKIGVGLDWLLTTTTESKAPELVGKIIADHLSGGGGIRELEAEDWLEKQSPGAIRDQGYASLSEARLKVKFFEKALQHAGRIMDEPLRTATRKKIEERWLEHDSKEARLRLAAANQAEEAGLSPHDFDAKSAAARPESPSVSDVKSIGLNPNQAVVGRVCRSLSDLEPDLSEEDSEDIFKRIASEDKAYKLIFEDFLHIVEGLRTDDLLAAAKKTNNKKMKTWLVLLAAEQDPMRIYQDSDLKNAISIRELFDAIASKDPALAMRLISPNQPRENKTDSLYLITEPSLDVRIRVATKLLGVDFNAGMTALLKIHASLGNSNGGRIPIGTFGSLGIPTLPPECLPGIIEAIGKPEYTSIKPDLIKMTVTHTMFNGGVLSATQSVGEMQLSGADLDHAIECITKIGGFDTNPVGFANWISQVRPSGIPAALVKWSDFDLKSATDWLVEQKDGLKWAQAINNDEIRSQFLQGFSGK